MLPGPRPYRAPRTDTYDYIVAGGGASGCVVAAGLARDGRYSVLLIEGGRRDTSPWIHITGTFFKALATRDGIVVVSEPEAGLLGQSMPVPQGTVLGGGSSVNAMCYVRGQRQDYDGWAAEGADGWTYADVLPVFKAQEFNTRALASPIMATRVRSSSATSKMATLPIGPSSRLPSPPATGDRTTSTASARTAPAFISSHHIEDADAAPPPRSSFPPRSWRR